MKFCEWLGNSKEKLNWYEQLEKSKEPLPTEDSPVCNEETIWVQSNIFASGIGKQKRLKPSPTTFYPPIEKQED